jgi:hypothetical protein
LRVAILDASLPLDRDYHSKEDDHPTDHGAPPAIDLGPINGDQHQPEATENDAGQKPGTHGPEPTPPKQPEDDMSHDGVNSGDKDMPKNDDTPAKYTNSDDPATAPSNPAPDIGPDKSTTDIPIFLGPNNVDPPSGNGPQGGAPHDSNYQDDDGEHRYPNKHKYLDDTYCDHSGEPLINLLSGNGGDGGDASSGAATRQGVTRLLVHVTDLNAFQSFGYGGDGTGTNAAYSGPGGDASGGSVYGTSGLINILSGNGGDGGTAKSGDSYR